MMKEIFFPEKLGSVRLYSQRIVGIAIQEKHVSLAVINAKNSSSVIEKLLEIHIPQDATEEQIAAIVKKLVDKAQPYDQVKIAIPSSYIIFKELEVPFTDPEKIRMVLSYEVESMLPFSLDDAIIDFVITEQNSQENKAQVLVAAIRYQDLDTILEIYRKAGIDPDVASIDLISLYNLYQQIPQYQATKHGTAIVDIGSTVTRVSFITNGQLRVTRNIPRGLHTVVEQIHQETAITHEDIYKYLRGYGVKPTENELFDKSLQQHMINFFNDIQFSLNSFSLKLNYYKGISKIFLAGISYSINGLAKFCTDLLQISTENFDVKKALQNKHIVQKLETKPQEWMPFSIALGTAIPSLNHDYFNLRRKSFVVDKSPLIKKQLITAAACFFIIIGTLSVKSYLQIGALKKAAAKVEKKEAGKLLSILPKKERPKVHKLPQLVRKAQQMVDEKEELWASFGKKE